MASKKSKELWQKAIPVSKSWIEFASPELLAEYQKIQNPNQLDNHPNQEGLFSLGLEALGVITNFLNQNSNLVKQMKDQLEAAILDGRYIAFGFRELPSRGNGPVKIDISNSMSLDIDWQQDELSTHDFTYNRVRILSLENIAAFKANKASGDANNAKNSIRHAIKNLMNCDPRFIEFTRKQQCEKVRDELNIVHTKYDGYSDKNIEKHLLKICGPRRKKLDN